VKTNYYWTRPKRKSLRAEKDQEPLDQLLLTFFTEQKTVENERQKKYRMSEACNRSLPRHDIAA
jgi:hypothetical protein